MARIALSQAEPSSLTFSGAKGGPKRRSGFNRASAWPEAVCGIGAPNLHFHDLRHVGNMFAAESGTGLKDLMARMGHDILACWPGGIARRWRAQ
ncbi:hypothetical protein [Acrocarpospora sp. B8E8]|uniref:hypothetical protein n=1 Tax=Acrocarpospora sp. B8E8 TaxID=3153572 RepID=UPI00325E806A